MEKALPPPYASPRLYIYTRGSLQVYRYVYICTIAEMGVYICRYICESAARVAKKDEIEKKKHALPTRTFLRQAARGVFA